MSNYWVWSTSLEHFEFSFLNHLWATTSISATKKIKKNDQILFYVPKSKEQNGEFRGIFDVTGKWTENISGPKWPQEIDENRIKWKYQIRVEPQLTFTLKLTDAKFLPFIQSKKNAGLAVKNASGGPANNGKPLSKADIYALKTHIFWKVA